MKKTLEEHQRRETKRKKKRFLQHYSKHGNQRAARAFAPIGQKGLAGWRKESSFAEQYEQSKKDYVIHLEAAADKRGVEGVDEDVYYEGKVVGTKKKYSDALLMFRMKGLAPETYKERMDHSGNIGSTVKVFIPENDRS